jgi:hypothetical protein
MDKIIQQNQQSFHFPYINIKNKIKKNKTSFSFHNRKTVTEEWKFVRYTRNLEIYKTFLSLQTQTKNK